MLSFLTVIASESARPKSQLEGALAALVHMYKALGVSPSLLGSDRLRNCVNSLVKSYTVAPMPKTDIMPMQAFHAMFMSWRDNEALSIKDLRLKAICLLALTFMLRPSDVAPRAHFLNPDSQEMVNMLFSDKQVSFLESGELAITFHGIKNDSDRDGFRVIIPPASETKLDPVLALKTYMRETDQSRAQVPGSPVFLTLRRPFRGLQAGGVSSVLNEAIKRAGLGRMGYSAKCFRPTAASNAVSIGSG